MENASKALIIAGAILLAILIIALGVFIFNKAKSATNMDDLSNQQVGAHNSTFQNYEGTINGTQAKALIDAIRNNNQQMPDLGDIEIQSGKAGTVTVSNTKATADLTKLKNAVQPTEQYEVSITDYQTTDGQYKGYVTKMTIAEK